MRNERERGLDRSASETIGQPAQGESMIQDLTPNPREADDVRGGILPPSEVKLGVLPPDGISAPHLVPPNT